MLDLQRTIRLPSAFGAYRSSPVVTVHAVVVHSAAMVSCDITTPVTLVLDVLISMALLLAISDSILFILIVSVELAS